MVRKSAIAGIIVVVCLATFILSFLSCAKKEVKYIKIGVVVFLTGDAAQYGKWVKNGLEIAKEEINQGGGINGEQIKLIYEDDQTSSKMAVSAINKLINVDKVPVIIGGVTSSSFLAMAPIAELKKVVLFSPCSSSPDITKTGDYIFRNWPSDTFEGKSMAEFAYKRLGVRTCSILAINNDYGVGVKNVFQKELGALGGKILSDETFDQGKTDFRNQILKLKNLNPQTIYMPGHAREVAHIIKQMKELNFNSIILGSVTFESPEIFEIAGSSAEGAFYTAPSFDPNSEDTLVRSFQERYYKLYGEKAEVFAAHAYDALKLIVFSIEKGGYVSDGIKNALYSIKNYPGVSGMTSFDENGDVNKPSIIKTVKGNKFVIYRGKDAE